MLYSMTGFGAAEYRDAEKQIRVEIKTLNSKYTDIKFRLSHNFKEKEIPLKRKVQNFLKHGKADITIDLSYFGDDETYQLMPNLIETYYKQIIDLQKNNPGLKGDHLQAIMRIPSVVVEKEKQIDDQSFSKINEILDKALSQLDEYRLIEGDILLKEFRERVNRILSLLNQVSEHEDRRIELLRDKFQNAIETFAQNVNVDKNRMEQEIIYYMEKLDVTEEKTRLKQHCEYFLSQIENNEVAKGKKLNFIAQEMGREINTLGSKANSSDIQHIVVNMKDELEKIKEQIGNIV